MASSSPISLRFESELPASRAAVWRWITSVDGIRKEHWPFFRMTVPPGVKTLNDVHMRLGTPLFHSRVLLFGFLPIDYSDVTLIEFESERGFLEESPMGSMRLWRHQRNILDGTSPSSVILVDQLTFEPRFGRALVSAFIKRAFAHRHEVMRAHFASVSS